MSIKIDKKSVARIGIGAVAAVALVVATVAITTAVVSPQTTGASTAAGVIGPATSTSAPS